MFCPQCGKQLPDGSSFCSACGYQTSRPMAAKEYHYKATPNSPKGKGKVVAIVAVTAILVVALAIVGVFLLKENRDKQFIDLVKNGYLGGYSDITVLGILEEDLNMPLDGAEITWKSYEDKALGRMVNADCTWQGKPLISYCFRLLDDQVFEVSSVGSPDLSSSDAEEISKLLNQMYVTHYNKQGMDIEVLTEKLSHIHAAAVLYGASADYSGNRGDLYLQYRTGTQPYSVADLLGLTEDDEEDIPAQEEDETAEDSPEYDMTTDYSYYEGEWKTLGSDDVDYVNVMLTFTEGHNPVMYYISFYPRWADGEVSLSGSGYIEDNTLHFSGADSYNNQVQGEMKINGDTAKIKSEVVTVNPFAEIGFTFDTIEIGNYSTGHFIDP